jgi:predicted TIM-barrel fold metal-dependent hydrolase
LAKILIALSPLDIAVMISTQLTFKCTIPFKEASMRTELKCDVHCHFFNIFYLFKEVLAVLLNSSRANTKFSNNKLKQVIKWFFQVVEAVLDSCECHYDNIQSAYNKSKMSTDNDNMITVPLMMDIYYWLHKFITDIKNTNLSGGDNFELRAEEIKDIFIIEIDKFYKIRKLPQPNLKDISTKFDEIIKNFKIDAVRPNSEKMSYGYKSHYNELKNLRNSHPETVFPFLAVDPRRDGITDIVKKNVSQKGPFFGIKLYTRLGYLPDDIQPEIYQYCVSKHIPITVHCSDGGFPPGKSEFATNADPTKWDTTLEKYNTLRIDFAHFGRDLTWMGHVIELMSKYPNVYSDLSYYPDKNTLKNIVKPIWDRYQFVREKLMFGTDYVMVALDPKIDLPAYFNNFCETFSPEDIATMTVHNPRAFLFGKEVKR